MKNKIIFISITVIAAAALLFLYFKYSEGNGKVTYKTIPIEFGSYISTISATGTIEPEELVDIGAQVSGRIISLGKDSEGAQVDYCSVVNKGSVLAKIDDALYLSDINESQASLDQALASLEKANADIEQLNAKLNLAENNYKRADSLRRTNANSIADFDSYKYSYDEAKANLAVGKASVNQASASVDLAKVALARANLNLGYCTITSPVDGTIIDKRIEIGQTVNSNMSAPSLFLIAKDLNRMELWVTVNEADIGKIKPDQKVSFTVDTYPEETFYGKVKKVRLNASVTQNVVTYVVIVSTENPDGKLLPYLTAGVKFEISNEENVYMVNNAALRWTPDENSYNTIDESKIGTIWIIDKNNKPKAIDVKTLSSNDKVTVIESRELQKDMKVIIGTQANNQIDSSASNPFLPKMKKAK